MPWRRFAPYADPLHAGRHPFQTYIMSLCIVSGLPLLFGHVTSGAIEESLPHWMGVSWGAALLGGAVVGMGGAYWRGSYANGLTLESVGLAFAGCAALAYSAVLVISAWDVRLLDALTSACIVGAFGGACLRRVRDIHRVLALAASEELS